MTSKNIGLRLKYACKFPNCKNAYYIGPTGPCKNKHFYKFPRKPRINLLRKWKKICNIKDEVICDNLYVCEDHFLPKDFINETRHRINYMVIPKNIVRLDNEERSILSDHTYFKLQDEPDPPNLGDNMNSHADLNINEPETNNSTDTGNTTYHTTSNITPNDKPDRLSVSDKLLCDSFAKFETDHLNNGSNEDIKNVDCNPLCIDSRYDFLLFPFDFEDTNIANGSDEMLDPGLQELLSSPAKSKIFKIHTNVTAKLAQLRKLLCNEKEYMNVLLTLYKKGKFNVIYEELGQVCDSFIELDQIRCSNKKSHVISWTTEDKTIALFLYKQGSCLYKYLLMYFDLPSITLLKVLFANISFDTGLDPTALLVLKSEVLRMNNLDKYCGLVFDKIYLDQGFYYDASKQTIRGYQDLGHLGRSHMVAKYALVFTICGLNKPWKQIIAHYFIGHTLSTKYLKSFIIEIISQLQNIGLNVVATICDHMLIYQNTLKELCKDSGEESFYFIVNNKPVVTIFNVPHLLKSTRMAFIDSNIKLDENTFAKFEYIKKLFIMDKKKTFKTLPKLIDKHFLKDVNVKIAAAQLSNTVAAGIETLVITNFLPQEAIYTAQFVSIVDDLFDSLNGYDSNLSVEKKYRCPLTDKSPHINFWTNTLVRLDDWKVIDPRTSIDGTISSFVEGWQCTIRSVMFLWDSMKRVGFKQFNLKALNKEHLEHLFYCIKQYSTKTIPTCIQFLDALKTCIINDYSLPFESIDNCQINDSVAHYVPLCNLTHFWIENVKDNNIENIASTYLPEHFLKFSIDAQYIIEYILNSIDFDEMCSVCKSNLFSLDIGENNSSVYAKESDTSFLVSQSLMTYLNTIADNLYKCLEMYSYLDLLEDRFKAVFLQRNTTKFCNDHVLEISILEKVVPLLLYRYVKDNNNTLQLVYDKHKC